MARYILGTQRTRQPQQPAQMARPRIQLGQPGLPQQDQGIRPGAYPHMNPALPDAAANKISLTGTGFTTPSPNYQNAPGSPINQQRTMASMLANGRMLNPQVQSYIDGLEGTPQQRTQGRYSQMLENRVNQMVGPTYAGRQSRLGGLASRLGQPQQRMDGRAALQGRLTATGAQYPTALDQGPQQPSFQPQAGSYGNSVASVSPNGMATVQGNITPRRLNALGVDTYRPYEAVQTPMGSIGDMAGTFGISTGEPEPPQRSYARMLGRQTANTRRMENMRLARRLGQTDFRPDDPIRPEDAMGMDDIRGALGVQGNIARQLGAQQVAQRRPQGRFASALGQSTPQSSAGLTNAESADQRGQRLYSEGVERYSRNTNLSPEQVDQAARNYRDVMMGGSSGAGNTDQTFAMTPQGADQAARYIDTNAPYIAEIVEGSEDLTNLRQGLTQAGLQPGSTEWKAAEAAFLGRRSPAERQRQNRAASTTYNPPSQWNQNREGAANTTTQTYSGAGFVMQ